MADEESSGGGRLTLGQRVHQLEHEQSKTRKEVKRIRTATGTGPDDENVAAWVGKKVLLVPATTNLHNEEGILRKVGRYTYLVDVNGRLEVFNKGQVLKIRLAE